jgi:uncharacterized protein YjiS (DUF1127 family)
MIIINQQAKRIASWLNRLTVSHDLTTLSDRDLRDMGLTRQEVGTATCKLFWMI